MLNDELGHLVRRATSGTPADHGLSPHSLAELVDAIAARPALWEPSVQHDPSCRWYGSLYRDDQVDLWLLTWHQDSETQLHDHGGSSGAFRVLAGELNEDRPRRLPDLGRFDLVRRRRPAGQSVAFGPRLVHDVRNIDETPAVSLHAYSLPLSSMTYYRLHRGDLVATRTEPVAAGASPEAPKTSQAPKPREAPAVLSPAEL